jgi:hypothetical protein
MCLYGYWCALMHDYMTAVLYHRHVDSHYSLVAVIVLLTLRSVGIVRSRTKGPGVCFCLFFCSLLCQKHERQIVQEGINVHILKKIVKYVTLFKNLSVLNMHYVGSP